MSERIMIELANAAYAATKGRPKQRERLRLAVAAVAGELRDAESVRGVVMEAIAGVVREVLAQVATAERKHGGPCVATVSVVNGELVVQISKREPEVAP